MTNFKPSEVELTEDQKLFSMKDRQFKNLVEIMMTPRQTELNSGFNKPRGIFAELM